MHVHGSLARRSHYLRIRQLVGAAVLLLAIGLGPAVVRANAAGTKVLSQSWETGLKSEIPTPSAVDPLTNQPDQWLIFSGGFPRLGATGEPTEGGQGAQDTTEAVVGANGVPGWPAGAEFLGANGTKSEDNPHNDAHNFWHVQNEPQTVSIAPYITTNLISLPNSGANKLPAPPSSSSGKVAWFGDPTSGTYCGGTEEEISKNLNNGAGSKSGCETAADAEEKPGGGAIGTVQEGELVSPPFSLANAESAELQFKSWSEISAKEANKLDIMEIDYTTNEGTEADPFHWTKLETLNPAVSSPTATADQNRTGEGENTVGSWSTVGPLELTPAIGSSHIRVRFVFDTWNTQANGFRGWLIDNVSVVSHEPPPKEPPPEEPPSEPPPVITTTSPPPKQTPTPTPAPTPTPTPIAVPATKPPFAKLIIIYEKSGEIETEYDFPEGGIAEEGAEVLQGASIAQVRAGLLAPLGGDLATVAATGKKCKQGFLRKGTRCVSNKPVQYGRARLTVPAAGHYNLRIKPSRKIITALRSGKKLNVQLTLMFTPAATTHHIRIVHNVKVWMKQRAAPKHKKH
jgi:hypothetical protein